MRSEIKNKTVLVAMSGGVDSSVAAAVLLEQGYRVFGMTMLLWPEDVEGAEEGCCGTVHLNDARDVCHRLGISHYTLDLQKEFLSDVVRPFVATYLDGRTPNPCISCNEHLKFRHLLRKATGIGADLLATGHYARILVNGSFRLARGVDLSKDQTYFLFTLGQEEMSRLLFPLGEMTKEDVRSKARSLDLPVHEKAESQEICFVPPGGLRNFISQNAPDLPGPGEVVDMDGKVIGRHEGACFYTVGQRKGLGIASAQPLYVVRIEAASNTVVMGSRDEASFSWLTASGVSWADGKPLGSRFEAQVQIRHRHKPALSLITIQDAGTISIDFHEPQHGVAPGQAVVIYDEDIVLGGGWISEAR
ncbi:MAG: tRNA 2-thiouridine(34) synthase MnmA [bacterium]|nr:tRNA 2-thiouridine(34) synthase MnmA [bacterium]MDT8366644.1 tRNA 2-thiouridine(34) synthase MnmA [bacterium]